MDNPINPSRLYELLSRRYQTQWLAPKGSPVDISIRSDWVNNPRLINYFYPSRPPIVQILGQAEYQQLLTLSDRPEALAAAIPEQTFALLFCEQLRPPDFLLDWWAKNDIKAPLIQVDGSPDRVLTYLYKNFSYEVALRVSLHGIYLDIYGMGVMITGEAGIGKSEIALEMISRGHKFIADDLVEFVRIDHETVSGSCPEILRDMIEVRSLGILNIRRMYGNHVVLNEKILHCVIALFLGNTNDLNYDRSRHLQLEPLDVLGVKIPVFPIQVRAGRNLAVLIEACVRAFLIRTQQNYDAAKEIARRQEKVLQSHKL